MANVGSSAGSRGSWVWLQAVYPRVREGDSEAANDLFAWLVERLDVLAAKMLGWSQPDASRAGFGAGDVGQEACLRLVQQLPQAKERWPEEVREFLGWAKQQLRWALLDLCRRCRRLGHLESRADRGPGDTSGGTGYDPPAPTGTTPEQLELWERFYTVLADEAVLGPEERQVASLRWFLALKQEEIAEILGVKERTVKRYWRAAKEKLKKHINLEDLS